MTALKGRKQDNRDELQNGAITSALSLNKAETVQWQWKTHQPSGGQRKII